MRFDELASKAGKAAADVGRRADRPAIGAILAARRRALIAGWLATGAVVVFIVGAALLWPASGAPSLPDAGPPVTSATASPTTTTLPTTTLTEEAPVIPGNRDECPVTVPGVDSFTPASLAPAPLPSNYGSDWYGTPELWTYIGHDGAIWESLPVAADGSLTQKTFWFREGYSTGEEPQPDITVTLERLDAPAPTIEFGTPGTSGANADLGAFMLVGIDIPHAGCWSITAEYQGTTLGYVAWAEGR